MSDLVAAAIDQPAVIQSNNDGANLDSHHIRDNFSRSGSIINNGFIWGANIIDKSSLGNSGKFIRFVFREADKVLTRQASQNNSIGQSISETAIFTNVQAVIVRFVLVFAVAFLKMSI